MKFVDYIQAIRALYEAHDLKLKLGRAASTAQLQRLQESVDASLDPPLVEAWRIAARSFGPIFARPEFLSSYELISPAQALEERSAMKSRSAGYDGYTEEDPRDPRIRPEWFADGWIPFAGFGGGTLLLISDLSPTHRGRAGQIIGYVHDPDEIVYLAPSFETFLDASLEAFSEDPEELLFELLEGA